MSERLYEHARRNRIVQNCLGLGMLALGGIAAAWQPGPLRNVDTLVVTQGTPPVSQGEVGGTLLAVAGVGVLADARKRPVAHEG